MDFKSVLSSTIRAGKGGTDCQNCRNWLAADAFNPSAYAKRLPASTAVVHTLGTLLEDNGYKAAVKEGDPFGVLRSLTRSYAGVGGNPLKEKSQRSGTYEQLNRDAGTNCTTEVCCLWLTD